MRTLIVYYSYTFNNEKLAKVLQQKVHGDILKIEELKKRTAFTFMLDLLFGRHPAIKTDACLLADYDHVIFVAPIWAGQVASPLKTFLAGEKQKIKSWSFITACGGSGQTTKIKNQLFKIVGSDPIAVAELPLSELLAASNNRVNTTSYRLTDDDFAFFRLKLEHFLTTNGMPLALVTIETD